MKQKSVYFLTLSSESGATDSVLSRILEIIQTVSRKDYLTIESSSERATFLFTSALDESQLMQKFVGPDQDKRHCFLFEIGRFTLISGPKAPDLSPWLIERLPHVRRAVRSVRA